LRAAPTGRREIGAAKPDLRRGFDSLREKANPPVDLPQPLAILTGYSETDPLESKSTFASVIFLSVKSGNCPQPSHEMENYGNRSRKTE
jgi:hypothetical protein